MTLESAYQTFADRCGQKFEASREGFPTLTLELVEVVDLRNPTRKLPKNVRQDPFQLCLLGPAEPMLPQGMYLLRHADLGDTQLFLVPSGPDGDHQSYHITVN